jgi:hypothetical protein
MTSQVVGSSVESLPTPPEQRSVSPSPPIRRSLPY